MQPYVKQTDFEVQPVEELGEVKQHPDMFWFQFLKYAIVGIIFGVLLVKAEVISWFRILEMFRFQSFHMYGVIGSAVVVGMVTVFLIKRLDIRTIRGRKIEFNPKSFNWGQVIGGLLFGFGWVLTGACPGPIYAIIGTGATVFIVALLSALAGTWVYGLLRPKLPH